MGNDGPEQPCDASFAMEARVRLNRSVRADLLALGFATSLTMWAAGYVCRLPVTLAPNWLLLVLMLACLVVGGFAAGRYTERGWRGGAYLGLLVSVLNLLILGSLLAANESERIAPAALWWIAGSFLGATLLGAAGASLGSLVPHRPVRPANWTGRFAAVAATGTFLLLIVGGLVTSTEAGLAVVDWPNSFGHSMFLFPLSAMTGGIYFEHAHRLFGSLVGLTTLVLAIHLQRADRRRWLRRLAWAALLVVIVQGLLGGLRVTGRFTLSASPEDVAPNTTLAVVHGVVAQVFLSMMVAVAVFTSTTWGGNQRATYRPTAGTDRILGPVLVVVLMVQLALGAVLRHIAGGLHLHIATAAVVFLLGLTCGVRAWGLYQEQPVLLRLGRLLMGAIMVQVALGVAALIVTAHTAGLEPRPAADVIITTIHQAVGALLLACAVMLMLWSYRLLIPQPEPGDAASASTTPFPPP